MTRVVVTGLEMITPCGPDRETSWQGFLSGKSVCRWLESDEVTRPPGQTPLSRLAGAPALSHPPDRLCPAAWTWAELLTRAALKDAGFDPVDGSPEGRRRWGVAMGSSKGPFEAWTKWYGERVARLDDARPDDIPWTALWPSSTGEIVARTAHTGGPLITPVAACATGLMACLAGIRWIQHGVCDVVLAGSLETGFTELQASSYRRLGVLAEIDGDPATAIRPFDVQRTGFLMGTGGAIFVLESLEHAAARGQTWYAEWLAGGEASDATSLVQVAQQPVALTHLIQNVLREPQLRSHAIDYLQLHGTGTLDNDRYEAQALRAALGEEAEQIPASSLKGTIGHLLGGAASVEMGATFLALRDGWLPPTANLNQPARECPLQHIQQTALRRPIETALKVSLGFGGHLGVAAWRRGNRQAVRCQPVDKYRIGMGH